MLENADILVILEQFSWKCLQKWVLAMNIVRYIEQNGWPKWIQAGKIAVPLCAYLALPCLTRTVKLYLCLYKLAHLGFTVPLLTCAYKPSWCYPLMKKSYVSVLISVVKLELAAQKGYS